VTAAVVDPSVLVSAFLGRADAAPGQLVRAWRDAHFTMIVCPLLLDELAEVLARPKFERWASEDRGPAYVAGSPRAAITNPIRSISP
jgi:predicted nucleic acid-binding protein